MLFQSIVGPLDILNSVKSYRFIFIAQHFNGAKFKYSPTTDMQVRLVSMTSVSVTCRHMFPVEGEVDNVTASS